MLNAQQAQNRWRGVVVPLITPFKVDGGLDLDLLQKNVRWLIDRGATQGNTILLAGGSGGDFTSMNIEERKQVIAAVAEVVEGKLPVIAGAQSNDIRECIAICQHCEALRVDAVQISGPFYYDGRPDDVLAWMREVSRNTQVGFALYNNWYTGYDMPMDLIEELLDIPNSIGVKWSSPNMHVHFEGLKRFQTRAAVVDNTLLAIEGHMRGCRAFVSHVPNYLPEHSWGVWELMEQGKYTEAHSLYDAFMTSYFHIISPIQRQTSGEGVFVRPFMEAVGLSGGVSRLPSRDEAVSPEIRHQIRNLLERMGQPV